MIYKALSRFRPLQQQTLRFIKPPTTQTFTGFQRRFSISNTMSAKAAALLIGDITHARKEWEQCGELATLKEYADGSREDFLKKCKAGEYDDVVAIYRSNDSTKVTGPFNEQLISVLPSSLKYICHNGAGYDNISVPVCTSRSIQVANTPGAVSDATADIGMFLLIGAIRQLTAPLFSCAKGQWRGPTTKISNDPRGKLLGIIGLGGIGMAMAKRAEAFGMKIQYYKRTKDSSCSYDYVDLDTLLKTSDVISLNLSLTPETTHFIDEKAFSKMKDGVVIVNTARGGLMDEKALVKALKSGKVGAAGLDVFEKEPEIEKELLEMDQVMCLPHMGTSTIETQRDMELLVLENLRAGIKTGKLKTLVSEQKSASF